MNVGVDGCKAGWLAVADLGENLDVRVHTTIEELLHTWSSSHRVFIDIPIGLPHRGLTSRQCDQAARKAIGPRASSVFTPPSRAAAFAASYSEAKTNNEAEVGRSLSAQAWGICKKIAEVDAALISNPAWRDRVYEVHPEVCFWALGGCQPMLHAKKDMQGRDARMALLQKFEPRTQALFDATMKRYPRSVVQADDILDALVALVTARSDGLHLKSLPAEPEFDRQGLPMRMMYRQV